MRKLLSLVLAFAMILGLFAFPVSADATTYQQVGQELAGLGVLKGVDAKGTLAEMQNLTREQALVVLTRLMGQEDKALATDAQPGFTDVPATHWSAKYVAYAKLQGWTNGTSETEFGLGQNVTTKQVVTLMMRALGYTADWSKEDVMMKAKELGLLEGVSATTDDAIIRGELFIVMKNTLYTKPMGEKAELIYKLGLAENPIPATLEVVDVKATNLKEVVVEFNQEVDEATIKEAFSSVGLSLGTLVPKLQEDGKTVVISLATNVMKNKQTYKITISKVKSLSGIMMEKVTKEFKTEDNSVPVVEKIVVTGPRTFDVVFSEPVKNPAGATVKLKLEGKTGPGVSVNMKEPRVYEAKTGSDLKDGKTYTALVTGFVDYAGYKNIDTEIEFDYAKVTNAPTVEVVKATQEYVVVKFDRPVKGLKLENFHHTYSAWQPVLAFESVEKMEASLSNNITLDTKKSYDKLVLRFIEKVEDFPKNINKWHPLQTGDVEFTVLGQVGSRKVVDNWGNQLQDTDIKVTVSADKEAPVVENVEIKSENEIEVMFSKKVTLDKANFEILKEDGSKYSGLTFTASGDGKKVTLKVTSPKVVGKTVLLNVKNVKDDTINMNKMVGTESFTLTFGDKTFDGVKEAILKYQHDYAENPTIFIAFREPVDSATATNIKNYKFANKSNPEEKDYFTIDADTAMFSDSIVQLTMSKETYTKHFAGSVNKVVVSNSVTDLNGNSFASFTSGLIDISKSGAQPPAFTKNNKIVAGESRFKLQFNFDQALSVKESDIKKSAFTVVVGDFGDSDTERNVESVEFVGDFNKSVLLTLSDDISLKDTSRNQTKLGYGLPSDLKDVKVKYDGATGNIVNELDEKLPSFNTQTDSIKIVDKVKPFFAKMLNAGVPTEYNNLVYSQETGEHVITITYDEDVKASHISDKSYVVIADGTEYELKADPLTADGKVVTLKLDVPASQVDSLNQAIADSLKNDPVEVGAKKYYQLFTVSVKNNHVVADTEGNEFEESSKAFDVYHERDNVGYRAEYRALAATWKDKLTNNIKKVDDAARNKAIDTPTYDFDQNIYLEAATFDQVETKINQHNKAAVTDYATLEENNAKAGLAELKDLIKEINSKKLAKLEAGELGFTVKAAGADKFSINETEEVLTALKAKYDFYLVDTVGISDTDAFLTGAKVPAADATFTTLTTTDKDNMGQAITNAKVIIVKVSKETKMVEAYEVFAKANLDND